MAVIETNNLVRNYKLNGSNLNEGTEVKVIKGLDLLVEEGDFIAIMGKSGCGKTTLMKLLGFIDKPTSGEIIFKGRSVRQFNKDEVADMKKTIILVTHDAQIASYCKKVIFLKDGNIIGHINKEHKKEEFYNNIIRMIKKL